MQTRVLIVDNAVNHWVFKPHWHWRAHLRGVPVRSVNLPSGDPIPCLAGFTHIILTGSETSILDPKPWFSAEAALVRQAVALGLPVLGSCFGHQMLVYALSGPDWLRPSNPPEVGWADVKMLSDDALFRDVPNPWRTFVYHFDEVFDPPQPWIRLGYTPHCETHVLRYGRDPVWGVQAHPEISSRKAKLFIQITGLLGRKPLRHVLQTLRHSPPCDPVADRLVERFLSWTSTDDTPVESRDGPRRAAACGSGASAMPGSRRGGGSLVRSMSSATGG